MRGVPLPQLVCIITTMALYMRLSERIHVLLDRLLPALQPQSARERPAGLDDDDKDTQQAVARYAAGARERADTLSACRLWERRYGVRVGHDWGFLPPALQAVWRARSCADLISSKRGCAGFDAHATLDQPGNDLYDGPLRVLTSGDCCVQCSRIATCEAWTHVATDFHCWLKGRVPDNLPRETQEVAGRVSGWRIKQ